MASTAAAADPTRVTITPEPRLTELEPLSGWAWTQTRGYFELPLDCVEDPGGLEVWHDSSRSLRTVLGEGLEDLEETDYQESWTQASWKDKSWKADKADDGYNKKDRDGDVPEWDGKASHRATYFRKIDLWIATTGVDPKKRGVRLLAKLTGEAFEKLENVDPKSLMIEDGVEEFKKRIEEVYEPIEDYRVGKIMDHFLYDFYRARDQEIIDYNLAFAREVFKVEKVAGELSDKWKAHLYLNKMKLSTTMKSQVLTGALGNYTVPALGKAALTSFPSVKDAFRTREASTSKGNDGWKTGGKPKPKGRFGKKPFKKRPWRANEAHLDDEGSEEESEEDEGSEEEEEEGEGDAGRD
jgi:hypothetical protein